MSKTQIRLIVSLIVIAVVSFLSACDYMFALVPKQGLPLDDALIGIWQTQDEQVEISKKNATEYNIVYYKGVSVITYTGYPVKIGGQLLVQTQIKMMGKEVVGPKDLIAQYQVISYSIEGSQLKLKSVKSGFKNQIELRKAIIANKPDIYSEMGAMIKVTGESTPITQSSFSAKGLNNEKNLTNIYIGHFNVIPFKRDNSGFGILFSEYLYSYAQYCDAYLPSNKIEITRQECASERVTRNGYGVEISRTCVEWRNVGTGLYADPKMYETKLMLDRFQTVNGLRLLVDIFKNPNKALDDTLGMVGSALDARSDMDKLVRTNTCSNPGLKRFQENLNLFALNKQPIILIDYYK